MRPKNDALKHDILKAAIEEFGSKGYAAVNLDDIAKKLNISRQPVYYYFKNKPELYKYAVISVIEEQKEAYAKILVPGKPYLEVIEEDFLYCLQDKGLFSQIGKGGKDEPDLSQEYNAFSKWLIDQKVLVLEDAKKRHEIKADTDVSEIITFLYIYYNGVIALRNNHIAGLNQQMLNDDASFLVDAIRNRYSVQ